MEVELDRRILASQVPDILGKSKDFEPQFKSPPLPTSITLDPPIPKKSAIEVSSTGGSVDPASFYANPAKLKSKPSQPLCVMFSSIRSVLKALPQA